MPNTKQPEQNKEWRNKFYALVEEYGTNWEDWCCLEEHMEDFIENLLKEQLDRVNKEVIELIPKKQNFTETLGVNFTSGYNSALIEINRKLKSKFLEQRQKLEEIKEKI